MTKLHCLSAMAAWLFVSILYTTMIHQPAANASIIQEKPVEWQINADVSGQRSHHPSQRIVHGENAQPGEFPFIVRIGTEISGCGGSLIDAQWILTASHCFFDTAGRFYGHNVGVTLGNYQLYLHDPGEVVIQVEQVIIHSKYVHGNHTPDIALLKLPEPVTLNKYIQVIDLPKRGIPQTGSKTQAIGWGRNEIGETPNILKKVNLTLLEDSQCRIWGLPEIICASQYGGHSICMGDSGGPLVCNENGTAVVCGVSSFVLEGTNIPEDEEYEYLMCLQGKPSFFVNVGFYLDWIHSHVKKTL